MKAKPIKIDWDVLEEAFNNRDRELTYYLDRVTGHVGLEGEGEDDDDDEFVASRAPTASGPLKDDAVRFYIQAPDTGTKRGWMTSFLDQAEGLDSGVVDELRAATKADDPTAEIIDILSRNTQEREAWYLYRAERVREMIIRWVEEHELSPVDPPPWT